MLFKENISTILKARQMRPHGWNQETGKAITLLVLYYMQPNSQQEIEEQISKQITERYSIKAIGL